ncbi:MAG: cell division protein FtsA [Candidatus Babeliales bacterium]
MKKRFAPKFTTAIDIGTTKICVLVASKNDDGSLEIQGIGQHPSHGLKKGVVVNIKATVESIKAAVKQAEEMAGCSIESACVGISGGHIKSFNSTGVVAIKNRDIRQDDIDRVIEAAKAIPLPQDQHILHVLPQYFRVDGQEFIFDSLGMYGVRLESQVHIVTGAVASAQNIIKSCELAGIKVSDFVLEQLASADAVLTPSERELGVGIIDIGGGTSDFAVYKDGRIRHSKVLAIAGNHFTNDLAVGLGIPVEKAEEFKRRYGNAFAHKNCSNDYIDVNLGYQDGIKSISVATLSEILRFRAEEIFDLFLDEINQYRLKAFMPTGLVLTGGGSLLAGIKELAQEKLGLPVRIGLPESYTNAQYPEFEPSHHAIPDLLKSPVYSTGYGLLVYGTGQRGSKEAYTTDESSFGKIFQCMKSWIYDFF